MIKWVNAWIWFLTPIPTMIFINNWFYYLIDLITYGNDPETQGYFPSLYNNWFAAMFMDSDNPYGLFKYWDMFTLQGFDNWFYTALIITFFPWWEFYQSILRYTADDWSIGTPESTNNVNKNRLLDYVNWVDPYDFEYWSNLEDGVDCNGNIGQGNYCFCPSQGYVCRCRK